MIISAIRQLAMDMADEQVNPSSGKFSTAWWLRQANYIKDVLAQETGHYLTRHAVAISQYTQAYALPSTLCWGIVRATLDGEKLDARDIHYMDTAYPGWKWEYGFPNQPSNDGIEVVSSSTADTTQKLTCYGTTTGTNTVVTEEITLNGTTQVATVKVNWGHMLYFSLDAACAGDLTIREASGNATIATIAAGDTSAGNAPGDDTPTVMVVAPPNFELYPVPDAAKTLYLLGGTLPADYTGDSDDPSTYGLPAQFHRVMAHGMAAMAEMSDIYDAAQQVRASANGEAFWAGVKQISAYLGGLQRDREQAIEFYNPHAE